MNTQVSVKSLYITMLRGFAALTVALGHILGLVPPDHSGKNFFQAPLNELVIWPVLFGREMVWLFIFISGFTLYRSITNLRSLNGMEGIKVFLKRRMIRILPTYYFGLIFGLIVVVLGSQYKLSLNKTSESLSTFEPITNMGIISHLLLIHNLDSTWTHQMNPPLWSIAVEMQLYLLLVIFFTKIGKMYPIQTAIIILTITKIEMKFTHFQLFTYVEWFIAGVIFSAVFKKTLITIKSNLLVFVLCGVIAYSRILEKIYWAYAINWLILFFCTFLFLDRFETNGGNYPKKIASFMTKLGESSYSLYVMHFPAALLCWWVVSRFTSNQTLLRVLTLIVSIPIVSSLTFICFKIVEKRSLQKLADF